MGKKDFQQKLVVITALFFGCIVILGSIFIAVEDKKIEIDCGCNPTVGNLNAKVHLVLFEDVNCYNCKIFSKAILPTLKEKYIDTNLVKFTIIPLAFMKDSAAVANAALCVHKINTEKFYPYMQKVHALVLEDKEVKIKTSLIQFASDTGGIDLLKLRHCMRQNHCYNQLNENLQLAKKTMGKKFGTPALFINGMLIEALTIANISKHIDRSLTNDKSL